MVLLLSNADQHLGQQVRQNSCRHFARRSYWATSCEFLLSLALNCHSFEVMVCIGCRLLATEYLLGDRIHLSQCSSRDVQYDSRQVHCRQLRARRSHGPKRPCCVGGRTGWLPSEVLYHHSDLQLNTWELLRCQPLWAAWLSAVSAPLENWPLQSSCSSMPFFTFSQISRGHSSPLNVHSYFITVFWFLFSQMGQLVFFLAQTLCSANASRNPPESLCSVTAMFVRCIIE